MSQITNSSAPFDYNLQQILESEMEKQVKACKKIEAEVKIGSKEDKTFGYILDHPINLTSLRIEDPKQKTKYLRFSIYFGRARSLEILLPKCQDQVDDKFLYYALNLMIKNPEYKEFYQNIIDVIKSRGLHIKDVNYKASLEQTVGMVAKEVFDYLFFESLDALTQSDQNSIRSLHAINGGRIISMNGASLPTTSNANENILNYFRSMSQVPPKLEHRSRLNYLPKDDDTVVFSQLSGTASVRTSTDRISQQIPMPVQPQTMVDEPKFNYNFVPSKDASYNWDFDPDIYGRKIYL